MTDLLTQQDKHSAFGEYDGIGGYWGDEFDLVDAAFAHCGYSNQPMPPVSIPSRLRWMREGGAKTPSVFVTDAMIVSGEWRRSGKRAVAWLLEPLALNEQLYSWVRSNAHLFYAVLSHDVDYFAGYAPSQDHPSFVPNAQRPSNYLWVPFGGCWVPKSHWRDGGVEMPMGINIIASTKNFTKGHQMRHAAIAAARDMRLPLEAVGSGYQPFGQVTEVTNLRYQVVIENDMRNGYFTEKLLNCFARGVVPIYWGCPDLEKYGFSESGVIRFDGPEDLVKRVIPSILKEDGWPGVDTRHNRRVMENYILAEDYIYEKYVDLFR